MIYYNKSVTNLCVLTHRVIILQNTIIGKKHTENDKTNFTRPLKDRMKLLEIHSTHIIASPNYLQCLRSLQNRYENISGPKNEKESTSEGKPWKNKLK